MVGVCMGYWATLEGCWAATRRGLYGSPVNRWSIKRTPNGTKLDRRSTGGVPRPLGQSRSIPRSVNTRSWKEIKEGAGGHRSAGLRNGQRGKCSDAWDEHVCKCDTHDDMIWNAWHGQNAKQRQNPTTKGNSYRISGKGKGRSYKYGKSYTPFGRDTHELWFIRILYVLHLYLLS